MRCEELERVASPYIDGECSPSDARVIEEHLVRCHPCLTFMENELVMWRLFSQAFEEMTRGHDGDITDRLLAQAGGLRRVRVVTSIASPRRRSRPKNRLRCVGKDDLGCAIADPPDVVTELLRIVETRSAAATPKERYLLSVLNRAVDTYLRLRLHDVGLWVARASRGEYALRDLCVELGVSPGQVRRLSSCAA